MRVLSELPLAKVCGRLDGAQAPAPATAGDLDRIAGAFSDILRVPEIKPAEPSVQEMTESDFLELQRVVLPFNQSSFGRLRQLIDALNRF